MFPSLTRSNSGLTANCMDKNEQLFQTTCCSCERDVTQQTKKLCPAMLQHAHLMHYKSKQNRWDLAVLSITKNWSRKAKLSIAEKDLMQIPSVLREKGARTYHRGRYDGVPLICSAIISNQRWSSEIPYEFLKQLTVRLLIHSIPVFKASRRGSCERFAVTY